MEIINWGQYLPVIITVVGVAVAFVGFAKYGHKETTHEKLVKRIDNLVEKGIERDSQIDKLIDDLRMANDDIANLGRAQDSRDAEMETMNDFTFLMLTWIKDALTVFIDNKIKPPDVPDSFYEFGEKYKGRFKK